MLQVTVTRKVNRPEFQTVQQTVRLPGFDKLTPRTARAALEIAFGQRFGGKVSDGQIAYQVYENSARKISED